MCLIFSHNVDDAVGRLHTDWAYFIGVDFSEAPAGDHCRPAHANRARLRRDDKVGAARDYRITGKAPAMYDRDSRNYP
jgi:hypothetical protein